MVVDDYPDSFLAVTCAAITCAEQGHLAAGYELLRHARELAHARGDQLSARRYGSALDRYYACYGVRLANEHNIWNEGLQ